MEQKLLCVAAAVCLLVASAEVITLPLAKSSSPLAAVDPNPADADNIEAMANKLYVASIGLGSPAQKLNLLIDTAFPNSFVFSWESLRFSDSVTGVNAFDSEESTSYASSDSATLSYGSKSLSTIKSQDYLTLASKQYQSNFDFYLSNTGFSTMSSTPSLPFDGVFGLSMSSSSNILIDYIAANANVDKAVFLNYTASQPQVSFGALEFSKGFLAVRIPLGSTTDSGLNGLFFSTLGSLRVGDLPKDYSNFAFNFVVSSSSYSILFPSSIFSDLVSTVIAGRSDCQLNNNKVRCTRNTLVGLPSLKFKIRGRWFELQPKEYFVNKGSSSGLALGVSTTNDVRIGLAFLQKFSVGLEYSKPAIVFAYPDICYSRVSKTSSFSKRSLSSLLQETLVLPQCSGGSTFTLDVNCPQSSCSDTNTIDFPYNFQNITSRCLEDSLTGSIVPLEDCSSAQITLSAATGETSSCTVELTCPHSNPAPDQPDSPPSDASNDTQKKNGMGPVAITFLVLGLVLFVVLLVVGAFVVKKRYPNILRRNAPPKEKTEPLNSEAKVPNAEASTVQQP